MTDKYLFKIEESDGTIIEHTHILGEEQNVYDVIGWFIAFMWACSYTDDLIKQAFEEYFEDIEEE